MSATLPVLGLSADPHTGVIRQLRGEGFTLDLSGGGCEFGDWFGFFSQDKRGGNNVRVDEGALDAGEAHSRGQFVVRLPSGGYRLRFEDRIADGAIAREYTLESLEQGALGDFVVRCAALRSAFPEAEIDGRRYAHVGGNHMRQFKTRVARLIAPNVSLHCELAAVEAPARLGVYTYVRDAKTNEWIMHHRLLTENGASDEYVLRVRYSAFSSRRSAWVKPLRHALWRAAERRPWIRPTIQVGGNVTTAPGERWVMRATMRVLAQGGAA